MIRREEMISEENGDSIIELILNFTGQRPKDLYRYYKKNYTFVVIFIQALIRKLFDTKFFDRIVCIHGGAQGIDQLSFWACYNLQKAGFPIINKVYVPFSEFPDKETAHKYSNRDISAAEFKTLPFPITGQEQQWIDGEIFTKAEYQLMLSLADYIRVLDWKTEYETKISIAKMLDRRNKEMVWASMLTIGIVGSNFDYSTMIKSGTRNCLRDAIDNQNEVLLFQLPQAAITIPNINVNFNILDLILDKIKIKRFFSGAGWIDMNWNTFEATLVPQKGE